MTSYDIFNGDADGICSLVQLRNFEPRESELVTGIKRDISLVKRPEYQAEDEVTVLDVSFENNRDGVNKALSAGAKVLYFDHHFAGSIPQHKNLETHIDTASNVCTSLLVDAYLGGAYRAWAVTGAFGDNLNNSAENLAKSLKISSGELRKLENLGVYVNYNGYGASLDDLHFNPAELFNKLVKYADPFDFLMDDKITYETLEQGYKQDMSTAEKLTPHYQSNQISLLILPNEAWARRVSGVYSNKLANLYPDRAHAVLTEKDNSNYLVSVRAPLNNKMGADEICLGFATGGGRKSAAGINDFLPNQIGMLIDAMETYYQNPECLS